MKCHAPRHRPPEQPGSCQSFHADHATLPFDNSARATVWKRAKVSSSQDRPLADWRILADFERSRCGGRRLRVFVNRPKRVQIRHRLSFLRSVHRLQEAVQQIVSGPQTQSRRVLRPVSIAGVLSWYLRIDTPARCLRDSSQSISMRRNWRQAQRPNSKTCRGSSSGFLGSLLALSWQDLMRSLSPFEGSLRALHNSCVVHPHPSNDERQN
jgi:hypothetical protein